MTCWTIHYEKMSNGLPYPKGTVRVFHNDDRQRWTVTTPGDRDYGNSICFWSGCGGEFFDGAQWRPMDEIYEWHRNKN